MHIILQEKVDLTKNHMDAVPPDDDTIYTLLGLLLMEEHGMDFTHEDMAQIWQKYLPIKGENGSWGCYWGERIMMLNLKKGMNVSEAGINGNPNLRILQDGQEQILMGMYVLAGQKKRLIWHIKTVPSIIEEMVYMVQCLWLLQFLLHL